MLEVNTITDDRQMRALTGLDLATFLRLGRRSQRAAKPKKMRASRWSSHANAGLVVSAKPLLQMADPTGLSSPALIPVACN